jgi:hypothetical protein
MKGSVIRSTAFEITPWAPSDQPEGWAALGSSILRRKPERCVKINQDQTKIPVGTNN